MSYYNLLEDTSVWGTGDGWTVFTDGFVSLTVEVEGAASANPAGALSTQGEIYREDGVNGYAHCYLGPASGTFSDIWLLFLDGGSADDVQDMNIRMAYRLHTAGEEEPVLKTVRIDTGSLNTNNPVLFISGSSNYAVTPSGYDPLGRVTLNTAGPPDPEPTPTSTYTVTDTSYVYEFEKNWSFDGRYIPHFLEINWWFGDSPVQMTGVQKMRIHGLSKGNTKLSVAVSTITEPVLSYDKDYSEPQFIDLPGREVGSTGVFMPVTNYTDLASRGLATQFKFEGRNQGMYEVEPPHVIQVLVIQGSPAGHGASVN